MADTAVQEAPGAQEEPGPAALGWPTWLALALAVLALLAGLWAWSARTGTSTSAKTLHAVILTDIDSATGPGDTARITSGTFITRAKTWTVYWSYYCLMPGVHRWQMRVQLVPMDEPGAKNRVLYAAHSPGGPPTYTEIYRLHGAGSYRFVVTATRRCVWSLRAPPVAGGASVALAEHGGRGGAT